MSVLCELPSRAMDCEEDDIADLISPTDFLQKDKYSSYNRKAKRSLFMSLDLGSPPRLHPVKRFKQSFPLGDQICDQIIESEVVVNEIAGDNDIKGDGSRMYALRTMTGKNNDLKTISHKTMACVINGSYDEVISCYRTIDCRYPYEYEGGHIKNAENIHTKNGIKEFLEDNCDVTKRQVLIFLCEFSSERGPKLNYVNRLTMFLCYIKTMWMTSNDFVINLNRGLLERKREFLFVCIPDVRTLQPSDPKVRSPELLTK
ncbi:unnamed protein product [Mytilus coruscus]|uniref:protein-tyrosine-phosphatase n=1 Tax=Mytilus coruscus TaxID=42192 RepID=A0A6J8DBE6_MYTCO|nr:unnamed protein product [Mytilus coruscus]